MASTTPRRLSRTRSASAMGKRKIMKAIRGGRSEEDIDTPMPRCKSRSLTHDMKVDLEGLQARGDGLWKAAVLAERNGDDDCCDPSPNKRRRKNDTDPADIRGSASDVSQDPSIPTLGESGELENEQRLSMFSPRRALSLASNFINRKKIKEDEMKLETANSLSSLLFIGRHSDHILHSLCEEVSSKELAIDPMIALFDLSDFHNQSFRLLGYLLATEIRAAGEYSTLFRGVSPATRVMAHMLKSKCKEYLHSLLTPILRDVLSEEVGCLEVDPNKNGGDTAAAAQDMEKLIDITGCSLRHAMDTKQCPPLLRAVLGRVKDEAGKKFGDKEGVTAVGGFFFLRFLCPAIVAPDQQCMPDGRETTPKDRRKLILVSKIIQNLSNGLMFGEKESYMCVDPLRDFMSENFEPVAHFLRAISEPARSYTPRFVFASKAFPASYHEAVSSVLRAMFVRQHDIERRIEARGREDLVPFFSERMDCIASLSTKGRKVMKKVTTDLTRMGATGVSTPSTTTRATGRKRRRGEGEEEEVPSSEMMAVHRTKIRAKRQGVRYESQPIFSRTMLNEME